MDTSSFHKFPQLPTELRLQIWEAACSHVLTTTYYCGLQYVDIYHRQAIVPKQVSFEKQNRSAYMLDSGLWKACKESKEVIAKHTYLNKNVVIREQSLDELAQSTRRTKRSGRPSEKYTADWLKPQALARECPVLIRSREDEECFLFVHPDVDVFCIKVDNWLALQHDELPWPSIELSVRRRPYKVYPPNIVTKIALLYDPSWATDLPNPLYNLPYEDSARGYLAYLIQQRVADAVRFGRKELYIIDKEAKWFPIIYKEAEWLWTPPLYFQRQVLYWDCDAEYVEVKWFQVAPRYNGSDRVDAAGFIHKLDTLVRRMHEATYVYGPKVPCLWVSGNDDPLTTTIKLLVRRDNQVKHTNLDCQPTCHRIGWCVCSEEERACMESARE
ncbi:uncharacterized protein B0J16DRAFT_389925 [Fusarium flagelliforme]|uniref:2EXR domain-containing protein n=1 Tax=Fusarium flagelliforme TaxID=2675880 RepID=A0A395MH72_9HYPO|nr:uncharacterized protein B0J16DRAFT_389925 [Fusarium flagelliforme]KAH7174042.1 hypothetical protein B0J16DRAFT_389925 [Fusarium flagelliforme]RFN47278.1 hypothetical protein FIE12Z_8460 [Fusarium flagelliforme]